MSAPHKPPLQNPIPGTAVDTSSGTLHSRAPTDEDSRLSGSVVQRAVDTIQRKTSLVKRSGHKKLLSLSKKNKPQDDNEGPLQAQKTRSSTEVESPFMQPDDSAPSSRPSLADSFRGDGSLRVGTQSLIQALQVMGPWMDEHGESKSDSDGEDSEHPSFTLSSSIHTIHRPVARIRKREQTLAAQGKPEPFIPEEADSDEEGSYEEEEDDFDRNAFIPGSRHGPSDSKRPLHHSITHSEGSAPTPKGTLSRTPSLSTVRIQRRTRLAEKLKEVFEVPDIQEVISEMPCWLLRSILLQGYMYLTNSHICFFAHMPSREDQTIKSGSLSKKAQRTRRWTKHWFVLKNDALTWYQSSTDKYFPHGVINLRYAISCDPHGEKGFRLRTHERTVSLDADSVQSREGWVKAIRKVIFKAQNLGESVKIAIPYPAVLEISRSTAVHFSDTIEVKVVDKDDDYLVDSYFFAYFHNISHALEEIRSAWRVARTRPHPPSEESIRDTTAHRAATAPPSATVSPIQTLVHAESFPASTSLLSRDRLSIPGNRLSALLKPFSTTSSQSIQVTMPVQYTRNSSEEIAGTSIKVPSMPPDHTYPPSTAQQPSGGGESGGIMHSWNVPVPSWLRNQSRRLFATGPGVDEGQSEGSGAYTSISPSSSEHNELGFSILDGVESGTADPVAVEKFRTTFALDEKETLIAEFPGYLFRVLPVFGKVDISTNYFCFRSSHPLTKTRMMIPLRDILATEKQKAFRFGHHGLVVVIKGHEELFFEFNSLDRRNAVAQIVENILEELREKQNDSKTPSIRQEKSDALILQTLEPVGFVGDSDIGPPADAMSDSLPAVMFTSSSSTFLTFKPPESLHFTCLTIGSRGDVQPYIALCKALKADGHRVRIATHIEFKDWIEGHGIEFGYVGGDPADLMRICVENGTFTVSFLREALSNFRGWLDDLLKTSWEACKGTDVLIESPSAISGIHIAEALRIPYYRAFTMPWTRTRAYPHAFAVPDSKMGGNYNYLTYVMFDQVFWRSISGQINRWRRQMLRLEPTNLDKLEQHKVPFLYNFSPTVVPPPLDWYEWIRITGYWYLDDPDDSEAKKWEPPSGLVEFIENAHANGKKVVYIGFGSIVVSDPDAMTQCIIKSVLESGVYAIMSKGWSDRLSTKKADVEVVPPLPPQIYNIGSVPHDWLFKRIDAACHHGGAGTVGASLRAGIPTIIRPFFGDQFFWADRMEALGIGSCVRRMTVDELSAALVNATTDLKQIARAKSIGKAIQSENGVETAIEAIYRDLEYARSIIKQPPQHSDSYGAASEDWSVISGDEGADKEEPTSRSPLRKVIGLDTWGFSPLPSKGGLLPSTWH